MLTSQPKDDVTRQSYKRERLSKGDIIILLDLAGLHYTDVAGHGFA